MIPYLDELDPSAVEIGAVNTIKICGNRKIGYNTDYYGFAKSLEQHLLPSHINALVLGTGGAAKAVWHVLKEKKIAYKKVSRYKTTDTICYDEINETTISSHTLIINTTPLGMYPQVEDSPPLPYHYISSKHYFYDLVYNPVSTVFLQKAAAQGATTKNGLDMLYYQAEKAWQIWND